MGGAWRGSSRIREDGFGGGFRPKRIAGSGLVSSCRPQRHGPRTLANALSKTGFAFRAANLQAAQHCSPHLRCIGRVRCKAAPQPDSATAPSIAFWRAVRQSRRPRTTQGPRQSSQRERNTDCGEQRGGRKPHSIKSKPIRWLSYQTREETRPNTVEIDQSAQKKSSAAFLPGYG